MPPISYVRHRLRPVVIQHAAWLYVRFTLGYRDVEDLLAKRGLDISYETIRRRMLTFEPTTAKRLRQRGPKPSPRWHLDETAVRIAGKQMYLWRAVDSEREVPDVLVQRRRDKAAAGKLMRKLLRKQGFAPTEITTGRLRSYGAAFSEIGITARHGRGLRKNNRAEVSHQPVRRRERTMRRFKSHGSAQCFVSMHTAAFNTFNVRRSLISRRTLRSLGAEAIAQWHAATSAARGRPCVEGLCAPATFP